jgi:hypothetical protein
LIHDVGPVLVGRRRDDGCSVSLLAHGKHTGGVHSARYERSFIDKDDLRIKTTESLVTLVVSQRQTKSDNKKKECKTQGLAGWLAGFC